MERLRISVNTGVHINQITEWPFSLPDDWFSALERLRKKSIFNKMMTRDQIKQIEKYYGVPPQFLEYKTPVTYSEQKIDVSIE